MHLFYSRLLILVLLISSVALHAIEVRGANQTLDIEASARRSGLAGVHLGMPGDLSSIYHHPAALNDINQTWILVSHFEHYESSQYDHLITNFPITDNSVLGFGLARFGSDGIPLTYEGEEYAGANYETFSISDYILTNTFALTLFDIQLGASLHLLYRSLDQNGFGFRTDISANYPVWKFKFSGLIKGLTTSAAKWESDTFEYSPPEFYTGIGYLQELPYFYGSFSFAWQSSGYLHNEGRSTVLFNESISDTSESYTIVGDRFTDAPLNWLGASSFAVEFKSAAGLFVRGGITHVHTPKYFSLGVGITILKHTTIDYAFQNHPDLSNAHHVSVAFCPGIFIARHLKGEPEVEKERVILPPVKNTEQKPKVIDIAPQPTQSISLEEDTEIEESPIPAIDEPVIIIEEDDEEELLE